MKDRTISSVEKLERTLHWVINQSWATNSKTEERRVPPQPASNGKFQAHPILLWQWEGTDMTSSSDFNSVLEAESFS